jgi:hypothetical protein
MHAEHRTARYNTFGSFHEDRRAECSVSQAFVLPLLAKPGAEAADYQIDREIDAFSPRYMLRIIFRQEGLGLAVEAASMRIFLSRRIEPIFETKNAQILASWADTAPPARRLWPIAHVGLFRAEVDSPAAKSGVLSHSGIVNHVEIDSSNGPSNRPPFTRE